MRTATCAHCAAPFTTSDADAIYCSRDCAVEARKSAGKVDCAWCGSPFTSWRADMLFCGDACRVQAGRVHSGRIKKISPPVFDYITRRPASGFACEAVAAE